MSAGGGCEAAVTTRTRCGWVKFTEYGELLHGRRFHLKLRSMMRAMCGIRLKDGKRSKELMLGLNEAIDQLSMVNSVCWYGHVLRREDGYVLRSASYFMVEGRIEHG